MSSLPGVFRAFPGWAWVSALYWASLLALRPFADIPLNDDWQYASLVERWLTGGRPVLSDLSVPTLVVQGAAGAVAALLGGFSHGTLRLTTMLAVWAGGLSLYALVRRLGDDEALASLTALLFLFNPLCLALTPTFMTDMNVLAVALTALALSWRGLEDGDDRALLAGSMLSALAYGVRQTGLMVPVGLTLALAVRRRLEPRTLLAVWAAPLAAVLAHQTWYFKVHGPTVSHYAVVEGSLQGTLARPWASLALAAKRLQGAMLYAGLFAWPLAAALWAEPRALWSAAARDRRRLAACALASVGLLASIAAAGGFPFGSPAFYSCRYLGPEGLGCLNVDDAQHRFPLLAAGSPVWTAVNAAAWASASTVAMALASPEVRRRLQAAAPLAMMFLMTLLSRTAYDRYLVPLAPAVLIAGAGAMPASRRARAVLGAGTLLVMALSWSGTYDYLRVMEAAWRLGERAVGRGHPPERVQAGRDWCWAHAYQREVDERRKSVPVELVGDVEPRCLTAPAAGVSMRRLAALVIDEEAYRSPLVPSGGRLYLYEFGDRGVPIDPRNSHHRAAGK